MTAVMAASNSLTPLIDRLQTSVVTVRDGERGSGAGVIWQPGIVITNAHVARASSATIVFCDGSTERDAEVIGRSEERDLAAVRVRSSLTPADIGSSVNLRSGEIVIAIGHPLGVEGAATFGVISRPPVPGNQEIIASSIYLNRGNSGGPLANAAGQVIGINSMVLTPGIGLAISANSVQSFLQQALGPEVRIGITAQQVELPASYGELFGLTESASLLIAEVESGSTAEEAGLLPGDLILTVSNREVTAPERLLDEIGRAVDAGKVEIDILRGSDRKTVTSRLMTKA